MNLRSFLLPLAVTAIATGTVSFASYKYQIYRVQKIEFIVWDWQHQNDANLTDTDLIRYVEACGATTATSRGCISISYRGCFVQKAWAVASKRK